MCVYLETWHLDIEECLELCKNTGDDCRPTHDINTANWIPDLFRRRVLEKRRWTLFSPCDVPDLHDRFGSDFVARLLCTRGADAAWRDHADTLSRSRRSVAKDAHHVVRDRLPLWITCKDACNLRSPKQHVSEVQSPCGLGFDRFSGCALCVANSLFITKRCCIYQPVSRSEALLLIRGIERIGVGAWPLDVVSQHVVPLEAKASDGRAMRGR